MLEPGFQYLFHFSKCASSNFPILLRFIDFSQAQPGAFNMNEYCFEISNELGQVKLLVNCCEGGFWVALSILKYLSRGLHQLIEIYECFVEEICNDWDLKGLGKPTAAINSGWAHKKLLFMSIDWVVQACIALIFEAVPLFPIWQHILPMTY
jgi:hypothetical protein